MLDWEEVAATCSGVKESVLGRAGHSATLVGSKVYVIGGRKGSLFYQDLLSYDTANSTWTVLQSQLPFPARANHIAIAVGQELWVIGGSDKDHALGDVHALCLTSLTWRKVSLRGDVRLLKRSAAACDLHPLDSQSILVFGGFGGPEPYTYLSDLLVINTSREEVHKVEVQGSLHPSPRAYHSFTTLHSRCYLFGGRTDSGVVPEHVALFVFDAPSNTWQHPPPATGAPPTPRSSHRAVATPSAILLHGGVDDSQGANRLSDVAALTPCPSSGALQWRTWPRPAAPDAAWPLGRSAHSLTLVDCSTAQLLGGYIGAWYPSGGYARECWRLRLPVELRGPACSKSPVVVAAVAAAAAPANLRALLGDGAAGGDRPGAAGVQKSPAKSAANPKKPATRGRKSAPAAAAAAAAAAATAAATGAGPDGQAAAPDGTSWRALKRTRPATTTPVKQAPKRTARISGALAGGDHRPAPPLEAPSMPLPNLLPPACAHAAVDTEAEEVVEVDDDDMAAEPPAGEAGHQAISWEQQAAELQARVRQLRAQVQERAAAEAQLAGQCGELARQRAAMQQQLDAAVAQNEGLQATLERTQGQLTSTDKRCERASTEAAQQKELAEQRRNELQAALAAKADLKRQLTDCKAEVQRLEGSLALATGTLKSEEAARREAEASAGRLQSEVVGLRGRVEAALEDGRRLEAQHRTAVEQLVGERDALARSQRELQDSVSRLSRSLERAEAQAREQTEELATCKAAAAAQQTAAERAVREQQQREETLRGEVAAAHSRATEAEMGARRAGADAEAARGRERVLQEQVLRLQGELQQAREEAGKAASDRQHWMQAALAATGDLQAIEGLARTASTRLQDRARLPHSPPAQPAAPP